MLKQAIEEYLLWMISTCYSEKTWKIAEYTLRRFADFTEKLTWEEIFTHSTLRAFAERHTSSHSAGRFTRCLWRYLYKQGKVVEPLVRKKPLPEVYEDYLIYYGQKALPDKVHRIRKIFSAFHDYLTQNKKSLGAIKITDIDAFLARYSASFNPKVRQNERYNIQGFLRYLYLERKVLRKDLASLLKSPPLYAQAQPPKFLRGYELQRLFKDFKPETPQEIRAYAMLHLAFSLGLRSCEISKLTLDDISFREKEIRIIDRKNTIPLTLPLSEDTIKAIAAYIIGVRPTSKQRHVFLGLFPPYAPICSAVVARAISKVVRSVNPLASAYWLRHTHAQQLLESGASIFEIKEMLGHESINTSEKYLRIYPNLMREVLFDDKAL